tara:strand:+ start:1306 stop:1839 length:534 start_codon:yes stop_codon:yes gene_type:complete
MKFLFTMYHPIIDELESRGHEVFHGGEYEYRQYLDEEEPESKDYPLKSLLRSCSPDVLVCVGPQVQWGDLFTGYARGAVIPWAGQVRGRVTVCLTDDDPRLVRASGGKIRQCDCRRGDFFLCVSNHTSGIRIAAIDTRVAIYRGPQDIDLFLEAVEDFHIQGRRPRMKYLPSDDEDG